MSKNKIVEYVMNTPGNTNRAILSQMVDLETEGALEIAKQMDAETLAMAKAYSDKKGGYTEPGKVLTYDGNKEGKEVFVDQFVKVSGIAENANAVVHISVLNHGEVEELEKGALSVIAQSDTVKMICKAGEDNPLLVLVSAETNLGEMDGVTLVLPIGTYIVDYGDTYVTRIEFAETIVPINPEHLPGVCLPVVELSTVVGADTVALNETDSSALESAIKTKLPIVMVLHENIEGAEALWSVHAVYADFGGMGCYIASAATTLYQFVNEGNGWMCYKQSMV